MEQGEFDFNDERRPKKKRIRRDLSEGRARRDNGMEEVLSNENPAVTAWKEAFEAAGDALIASEQFFHAEHIRGICGDPPLEAHHNIFGAMMNGVARRANRISIGQCERPTSHARSLKIYKGARRDED
jgi:hypothetical protein